MSTTTHNIRLESVEQALRDSGVPHALLLSKLDKTNQKVEMHGHMFNLVEKNHVLALAEEITTDKRALATLSLKLDCLCEEMQTWIGNARRYYNRFPHAKPLPLPGSKVEMTAEQMANEEAGLAIEAAVRAAMSGWMP
jgi:hypothetical protein